MARVKVFDTITQKWVYADKSFGKIPVKGEDYFTEEDKVEIAEMAAELVEVPTDAHINDLINTALGVIENGTY